MTTTIVRALHPYPDGSGHRHTVTVVTGGEPDEAIRIKYLDEEVRCSADEWEYIREAVDAALTFVAQNDAPVPA